MTLNEALAIKTEKRIAAINAAEAKRNELHKIFPRIRAIDSFITELPLRMISGENPEALRAESEKLSAERERILTAAGYESNYDAPKFECTECNDGGYCGLKLCNCIKTMVATENYVKSTLAGGLHDKRFENFSLEHYAQNGEREAIKTIVDGCKAYAEKFPNVKHNRGMLFRGGTGLGKTHLSAAIANCVSERGYSVIYESAQQIYDTLDAVRFNRMDFSERKKYENCALLIIDDLGAEFITQYSVAAISNLIDLRIVSGKPTIISTNLSAEAIKKTYGERVHSRLYGEFFVLNFVGEDYRLKQVR